MLNAHAGLDSMNIQIRKMCASAAAQIATLSDANPVQKVAQKAMTFVKRHRTTLHHIMQAWGIHPKYMETVEVARLPPGWRCPIEVVQGKTKEAAIEQERNNEADMQIYTDSSGYKGKIGAAAVLYRGMESVKVLRKCFGEEDKHTVFERECMEQILGLELLRREMGSRRSRIQTATIETDNQAGMKAMDGAGGGSARYIVDEALKRIWKIQEIDSSMEITGHQGTQTYPEMSGQIRKQNTQQRAGKQS